MKIGEPFNPRNTFVGLFIPEALAASSAYSSTAKLAYGHLVRRAGENGHCWPSAADVGKHTGVGERAAQRALKELQAGEHPLIRATFRRDKNGRQTSNEYAFIWCPILQGSGPVKNDTVPLSETTPSGVSKMTGMTPSKTTPEKCQEKSATGKVSDEDEGTSTPSAELAEMLPDWLDADAQRRIWQGCRRFAADCTPAEVAAAVRTKMRVLGKRTNPGLLISSVPKMFEGPRGFHYGFRQQAAEQARELQELERIARAEELDVPMVVPNPGPTGSERSQEPRGEIRPDARAPRSPTAEICWRCGSDGVVNGTVSWCDCERGQEQRRARPGYVDDLIRTGWNPGAPAAAVQPRPPQSKPGPQSEAAIVSGGA